MWIALYIKNIVELSELININIRIADLSVSDHIYEH